MALLTSKKELPKGAVKLTQTEAIDYQWNQIKNWPKILDVWPFRIGIPVLVGIGTITSLQLNAGIRAKLLVRNHGRIMSCYTVGVSALTVTGITHKMFVTNKLMLYETACPICFESRAILLQLAGCLLYPTIISLFANCVIANKFATYRIPYFADGKGILQLYSKLLLPMRKKILFYTILNSIAASFLTYSEGKSLIKIRSELIEQSKINEDYVEVPKNTPNESSNKKNRS